MTRALVLVGICAAIYAFVAWGAAAQLPEGRVAIHVNAANQVDKYASRTSAIGYFVGIGAVLLLLALAVLCMVRFVPARFLNIPHKDYWTTPERAPTARRMLLWDCAVIFSMPLLAFSFVPVNIALFTVDPGETSALWIVLPMGIWLIAMVSYAIWMVTRRYRPASQ